MMEVVVYWKDFAFRQRDCNGIQIKRENYDLHLLIGRSFSLDTLLLYLLFNRALDSALFYNDINRNINVDN